MGTNLHLPKESEKHLQDFVMRSELLGFGFVAAEDARMRCMRMPAQMHRALGILHRCASFLCWYPATEVPEASALETMLRRITWLEKRVSALGDFIVGGEEAASGDERVRKAYSKLSGMQAVHVLATLESLEKCGFYATETTAADLERCTCIQLTNFDPESSDDIFVHHAVLTGLVHVEAVNALLNIITALTFATPMPKAIAAHYTENDFENLRETLRREKHLHTELYNGRIAHTRGQEDES